MEFSKGNLVTKMTGFDLSITKDDYVQVKFVGKNKFGDEYTVVHETPFNGITFPSGSSVALLSDIRDMMSAALSEFRACYDR